MQVVVSGVGDLVVNPLDPCFRLPPVDAEFGLVAHLPLGFGQAALVFPEAVERVQHGFAWQSQRLAMRTMPRSMPDANGEP